MDLNIAALLREDAKTIKIVFDNTNNAKQYTYVTHLDVVPGDFVIVDAAGERKVVYVVGVDSELDIEPNSKTRYKWVIDKIDIKAHVLNEERNLEIEKTLGKANRENTRQQLHKLLLSGVDEEQRETLTKLIGGA
jgi:hypothetical protein